MKQLSIFLAALIACTVINAQKKPLDHTVYDGWQSMGEKYISNNGLFVVYTVTPQEGDALLVIQQADGKKLLEVPRGYSAAFTEDSRFAILKIRPPFKDSRDAKMKKKKADDVPKDSMAIVTLASGKMEKFARVTTYKLPEKSANWLAWQYEKPLPDTSKKTDTSAKAPLIAAIKKDSATTKSSDGSVVILRNLNTGAIDSLPGVSEYLFDKKGTQLMYKSSGSKKDSVKAAIIVYDLNSRIKDTILKKCNDAANYAWDEEGKQLIFVAETDSSAKALQKFYKLWYYKTGTDTAQLLASRETKGVPANWAISENTELKFSKSGARIMLGTAPILPLKDTSLPEFERAGVDVWNYKDDDLQPFQLKNLEKDLKKSYTALWDWNKKEILQLADEKFKEIQLTKEGDGDVFYTSTDFGNRIAKQWQGYTLSEVYAVNPVTGEKKLVIKDFKGNLYPSYTGKYLLLYQDKQKAYSIYNSATGKLYKVGADIKVPLYDEDNDVPDDPNPYGIMKWVQDDKYILLYDRYDVWQIDPENKQPSRCITNGLGRKGKLQIRYTDMDKDEKFITPGQKLFYIVFNETNKSSGWATMSNLGAALRVNYIAPANISVILKAKQADAAIYTQETFRSRDLYYTTTLDTVVAYDAKQNSTAFIKLSNLNPQQANYLWGTAELFKWKAYTGKQTEGILYKPDNFDATKKYPMLVYFYERNNQSLYNYKPPAPTPSIINISFFVSRGYIVFVPDIWYKTGHPGKSAYDYIVSGTRALIKTGFVDSTKIGIQGQSWGGYQTAYVITQTHLFAAAWAGAPVVNMFSAYGGIRWESGVNRQMQYELQQSRIGATIWQKPELYIENSPLFHLPNVTTPLVIMSNDADGAVPWYQGIEFFTAMRRLNKPVWLLNYNGEAHNIVERRNRKDIQIREQQYFDWLLKGEQPPKWITEGVPAIMKGRTWGL